MQQAATELKDASQALAAELAKMHGKQRSGIRRDHARLPSAWRPPGPDPAGDGRHSRPTWPPARRCCPGVAAWARGDISPLVAIRQVASRHRIATASRNRSSGDRRTASAQLGMGTLPGRSSHAGPRTRRRCGKKKPRPYAVNLPDAGSSCPKKSSRAGGRGPRADTMRSRELARPRDRCATVGLPNN